MRQPRELAVDDASNPLALEHPEPCGGLAAGAVGVIDASLLLYPVYYCLVNGAIAVLIDRRRRALRSEFGWTVHTLQAPSARYL